MCGLNIRSSVSRKVKVTIHNYQLFRQIDEPGWRLGWTWLNDEVIWYVSGAEATRQGDCRKIHTKRLPHTCEVSPVFIDLLSAPDDQKSLNCCKAGLLSSYGQNASKSVSQFDMIVASLTGNQSQVSIPSHFNLGIAGYQCGSPFRVPSTTFPSPDGRRLTQALYSWHVICSYSQPRQRECCASLSAFYSEAIVGCASCSCGCRSDQGRTCLDTNGGSPSQVSLNDDKDGGLSSVVKCTAHMCPVRVHWHVQTSYRGYWRAKVTVTNFSLRRNFSDWNVVVMHPNFDSVVNVSGQSYKVLDIHNQSDAILLWGTKGYSDLLLQHGKDGYQQVNILMTKREGIFTFKNGWTFPRSIFFNGEECAMPTWSQLPKLPPPNKMSSKLFTWLFIFGSTFLLAAFVFWFRIHIWGD